MELSDDLKRAVEHAHGRFSQGINPLLHHQFLADGFPDTLCHYTDFRGLQGILETRALWATCTQTLNDGSERAYGLKVVYDYIARFPNSSTMHTFRASMELAPQRNFACCFCESSELLSMWITCSHRGGGYCVEFEGATSLLKCSSPPFATRLPFKLNYPRNSSYQSDLRSGIAHTVGDERRKNADEDSYASDEPLWRMRQEGAIVE